MIIANATDAAELLAPHFVGGEVEAMAVVHLDGERRLIELVLIPGAAAHGDFPVRRIVEDALRLGAAGLIVAHDHPSGDAQPEREDVEAARELAEMAARLGIRLHDSLIFAGGDMVSLRSTGLL